MKPLVTMVAYSIYDSMEWYDISLRSFKDYFPDHPVLIVDHNKRPHELHHFQQFGHVIQHDGPQKHGDGIDAAVKWCRKHGFDVLIHIEPDCVVKGRMWYDHMLDALSEGFWMAGTHSLDFGVIHPCPSAWMVSEIRHSFAVCPMGKDKQHPLYHDLINVPALARMLGIPTYNPEFWLDHWDCGIKNWFECSIRDKAKLCRANDLLHFWCGRKNRPGDMLPAIQDLLSPYWNHPKMLL